jgi:hypothetical protein
MSQLNFPQNSTSKYPPQRSFVEIPILSVFENTYLSWHNFLTGLPRLTRYTLGIKIDNLFTDCLELSLLSSYASKTEKFNSVQKLSIKFDALKFFLKVLWDLKAIDNKKYIALSSPLSEIGKMIGG